MNIQARQQMAAAKHWLQTAVFPLWSRQGIDRHGGFVENLSREGVALPGPQRVMVQARQIYSFAEAARMGFVKPAEARVILTRAVNFIIEKYQFDDGSFAHVIDQDLKPSVGKKDLYGQAFALFSLAHGYAFLKTAQIKDSARKLLAYLERERRVAGGGFSEILDGEVLYLQNPHMHLFEAVVAWGAVDADRSWRDMAVELESLLRRKLVQPSSGLLCEHFSPGWVPQLHSGSFVFEPGHQYEWSWLLNQYARVFAMDVGFLPFAFFQLSERLGVETKTGLVRDEMWSDGRIKKQSARFWPQCERIKAAVALGVRAPHSEQPYFAKVADEALASLSRYLTPTGLWEDHFDETGRLSTQPVKASSLYHILNALSEYIHLRPQLSDAE